MQTKQEEIEKWRSSHKFYTQETMRKLALKEKLTERARYRQLLYDWVINGYIGFKPLFK